MDSCIKSFDGRTFYATDFCCCPHCGATEIKKNGKTILFFSKLKPMQIKKMFSLLIDGSTLRQAGHMAKLSLQTVLLWRRKIEKMRRIKDFPMLSGNVHVDETYVNVARHGVLSVKRGVFKNKLRIAVAFDDMGH